MTRVDRLVVVLGVIGTFAIASVATVQYWNGRHQWRIDNTFAFLNRYNSGIILQERADLFELTDRIFRNAKTLTEYEKNVVEALTKDRDFIRYTTILGFFGTVYKCVKTNSCNEDIVVELFAGEADHVFTYVYPVIDSYKEVDPGHAAGLQYIRALASDTRGTRSVCDRPARRPWLRRKIGRTSDGGTRC